MQQQKKKNVLLLYTVIFYGLWTFFELVGKDLLDRLIAEEWLLQLIRSGVIKNLVWTFPALLLTAYFQTEVTVSLREMFTIRVHWLKFLPIFIFFTVYALAGSILLNGTLKVSSDFGVEKLIIVLFVGITEEMVFRGWLLNATLDSRHAWRAIVINACMFLVIHFPNWIHQGIFLASFADLSFLCILVLSVIFSWTFIKSRSLLVPIFLHMYWDLLVFLLL